MIRDKGNFIRIMCLFSFFLGSTGILFGIIQEGPRLSEPEQEPFQEEQQLIHYDAQIQRLEKLIEELEREKANLQIQGGEIGMYDFSEGAEDAQEEVIIDEKIKQYENLLRELKEQKEIYQEDLSQKPEETLSE